MYNFLNKHYFWAIVLVTINIIFSYCLEDLDDKLGNYVMVIDFALVSIIIALSSHYYCKINILHKEISFKSLLKFNIVISLIGATALAAHRYIHMTYINPNELSDLYNKMYTELMEQGYSESEITYIIETTSSFTSSFGVITLSFMGYLFSGIVASLIFSWIFISNHQKNGNQ